MRHDSYRRRGRRAVLLVLILTQAGWLYGQSANRIASLSPRGSLDLYFQHVSTGSEKQANWLPAPEGPFVVMMRLYWPKTATWPPPPLKAVP